MDGFESLKTVGAWAAVLVVLLTIAWLVNFVRSPDAGSTADQQLAFYSEHGSLLIRQFLPTTLVALLYVPLWVGLAVDAWDAAAAIAVLGVAFGLLYPPLVAMAYWTQYTVARGVAELAGDDPEAARRAWQLIGFNDDSRSVPGALVVLGYFVWGIAGGIFAVALLQTGGTTRVAAAAAFGLTAALTTAGAIGFVWRNRTLATGVLASGVTSVLATALAAVVLFG